MKVWQLYCIIGVLFFGVAFAAAVNYYIDRGLDFKFQYLVAQNKESHLVSQAKAGPESLVKGAQAPACTPCQKKRFDSVLASMSAQAVLVGDLKSGEILSQKNADKPLPIASLTKIMTAAVVLEKLPLSQTLKVSFSCANLPEGINRLGLKSGMSISVEDLLYGMLVRSGADCACVLGEALGGESGLVNLMNEKAADLNLQDTHFQSPVGNDALDNFSSGQDLFVLTRSLMENESAAVQSEFRKIVGAASFWGQPSTNQLLSKLSGITGVKTGSTPGAGECLAASWLADGREYLGIVLASSDRFGEVEKLVDLSHGLVSQ